MLIVHTSAYRHVVFCRKADADASDPSPSTKILYQRFITPVRHGNLQQIHPLFFGKTQPSDQHLGLLWRFVRPGRKLWTFQVERLICASFHPSRALQRILDLDCLWLGWWGAGGILNSRPITIIASFPQSLLRASYF